MKEILITHEPVELYKILKFEGIVDSGGAAKGASTSGGTSWPCGAGRVSPAPPSTPQPPSIMASTNADNFMIAVLHIPPWVARTNTH